MVEEKLTEGKPGRGAPDGRVTEAGATDETTAEEGKTGKLAPDRRATEAVARDKTTADEEKTGRLAPDGRATEASAIDEMTADEGVKPGGRWGPRCSDVIGRAGSFVPENDVGPKTVFWSPYKTGISKL